MAYRPYAIIAEYSTYRQYGYRSEEHYALELDFRIMGTSNEVFSTNYFFDESVLESVYKAVSKQYSLRINPLFVRISPFSQFAHK